MLTAAIASGDASSAAQLLACLEQTGFVKSVKQWSISGDKAPESADMLPDVVFLDLPRDPEPCFAFGANLRRISSAVKLVACSATISADAPVVAGSDEKRRAGLFAQARQPRGAAGNAFPVRSGDCRTGAPVPGKTDRGHGLEGRRRHDHGRGESGSSALLIRAQARSAARLCASARQRSPAARSRPELWHSRRGDEPGAPRQSLLCRAADPPQNAIWKSLAEPCSRKNGIPFPFPRSSAW